MTCCYWIYFLFFYCINKGHALIEEGLFDPMDGTYINPNTGEKLSLADAIEQGLIDPSISEDDFIDTSVEIGFEPILPGTSKPVSGSYFDSSIMSFRDNFPRALIK
jgi:hypothetical protein